MGSLSETSSLISIKVDIIDVERGGFKGRYAENGVTVDGETAVAKTVSYNVGFGFLSEFKVDLDFVVLQSDQGEGKTGVSAEPELKGYVQGRGLGGLFARAGKGDGVTNHIVITYVVTGLLGKFIPDVQPVAVVFIDSLTTDLNFYVADKGVTDIVDPSEAV